MPGKVYLVGAGPGDPGLITLRGKACLAKADVVVFDRLLSPRLLTFARPDAQLVYVGKEPDSQVVSQRSISAALVARALAGQTVVRLKGGDPFVFGRGGEEALELQKNRIAWEVVPGVSAAVAVAAYAGIPVTHRGVSTQVLITTGHTVAIDDGGDDVPSATSCIQSGTIVTLMGVGQLAAVVERLQASGWADSTPVTLVRWGTTASQDTLSSSLGQVVEAVGRARFRSPAVFVAGSVSGLQDALSWVHRRPLHGQRLLVAARTDAAVETLCASLEEQGADVVAFSFERFAGPTRESNRRIYLSAWGHYADGQPLSGIWVDSQSTWQWVQSDALPWLQHGQNRVVATGTREAARELMRNGVAHVSVATDAEEWAEQLTADEVTVSELGMR